MGVLIIRNLLYRRTKMQNLFDLSISRTYANILIIINANGTRINCRSTCDRSVSKLERRESIYRSDRCESLRCALLSVSECVCTVRSGASIGALGRGGLVRSGPILSRRFYTPTALLFFGYVLYIYARVVA